MTERHTQQRRDMRARYVGSRLGAIIYGPSDLALWVEHDYAYGLSRESLRPVVLHEDYEKNAVLVEQARRVSETRIPTTEKPARKQRSEKPARKQRPDKGKKRRPYTKREAEPVSRNEYRLVEPVLRPERRRIRHVVRDDSVSPYDVMTAEVALADLLEDMEDTHPEKVMFHNMPAFRPDWQ